MSTKKKAAEDPGLVCILPTDPHLLVDLISEIYSREQLIVVHDLVCDLLTTENLPGVVH